MQASLAEARSKRQLNPAKRTIAAVAAKNAITTATAIFPKACANT